MLSGGVPLCILPKNSRVKTQDEQSGPSVCNIGGRTLKTITLYIKIKLSEELERVLRMMSNFFLCGQQVMDAQNGVIITK